MFRSWGSLSASPVVSNRLTDRGSRHQLPASFYNRYRLDLREVLSRLFYRGLVFASTPADPSDFHTETCHFACFRNEFAGLEARVEKSKWWSNKDNGKYDAEELREVRWLEDAINVYTKALDTLWWAWWLYYSLISIFPPSVNIAMPRKICRLPRNFEKIRLVNRSFISPRNRFRFVFGFNIYPRTIRPCRWWLLNQEGERPD